MNRRTIQVQVLYLKLLSLTYLAAFISLYKQIDVLMSSRGIVPASASIKSIQDQNIPVLAAPTLFTYTAACFEWLEKACQLLQIDISALDKLDTLMYILCFVAIVLSFLAIISNKFHSIAVFFPCWIIYLSFVTVGGVFFHFQWDILLLEAG